MDHILCPNCGKKLEISKALQSQILDEKLSQERVKFEKQLEVVKKDAENKSSQKAKEQFELQLKRLAEDNTDKEERNQKLMNQIEQLLEENRKSKREKDDMRIEMQKKLSEEEEKIRITAQKKAEEEQHLKILEKDKQLEGALKELEDMRRKLQQGSQQMQGEAFELEFEEALKRQYANDKVEPVGKGIKGGDIIQEIWDRNGNYCGKILWELKNTKTWNEGWIDKLKGDQRSCGAEEAVLISEVLPATIKIAGFKNNVWVTGRAFFIPLADTLRAKLIQLYYVKQSVKSKDEKAEILYSYLSGTEFRHRVEAIIEAFTNMQTEIEKEKRYFSNKWARDEKNIRQIIDNTYGMHGDLKGIIGKSMTQITGLEILELEDGKTN